MSAWHTAVLVLAVVYALPASAAGDACEPAVSGVDLTHVPVKEVTVFKDGHAFVLHEGKAATTAEGDVILDHLPAPVMGTFWPYWWHHFNGMGRISWKVALKSGETVDLGYAWHYFWR